jgi:hypothetical protein
VYGQVAKRMILFQEKKDGKKEMVFFLDALVCRPIS